MRRCRRPGLEECPGRASARSALGVRRPATLGVAPSAQPFAFALVGVVRESGPRADARTYCLPLNSELEFCVHREDVVPEAGPLVKEKQASKVGTRLPLESLHGLCGGLLDGWPEGDSVEGGTVDALVGHGVAKNTPIVLEVPGIALIWGVVGLSAGIGRPRNVLGGVCPSGPAPALIGFPASPP
eukprot:5487893-Pyramimonas_sp.AAC.1